MCRNINTIKESTIVCKKVVIIPNNVKISVRDRFIDITGALGTLNYVLNKTVHVRFDTNDDKNIIVYIVDNSRKSKSLLGTACALLHGMIVGVSNGFVKKLQLVGIGYRVLMRDERIVDLMLGLSHSINYKLPKGVFAKCPSQTEIVLTSIVKQLVGQAAAELRAFRPPEPFKGKGIRYINEYIRIKDSKKK